jgi:MerR family transcriptional regulator/heat shock protein HspR
MARKYWTIIDIMEVFQVDEQFVISLEEEEIICATCEKGSREKRYLPEEAEKLRLAKILVEEMDVNLPGVDIILRMRQDMLEMRKQFDAILEDMANKLKNELE